MINDHRPEEPGWTRSPRGGARPRSWASLGNFYAYVRLDAHGLAVNLVERPKSPGRDGIDNDLIDARVTTKRQDGLDTIHPAVVGDTESNARAPGALVAARPGRAFERRPRWGGSIQRASPHVGSARVVPRSIRAHRRMPELHWRGDRGVGPSRQLPVPVDASADVGGGLVVVARGDRRRRRLRRPLVRRRTRRLGRVRHRETRGESGLLASRWRTDGLGCGSRAPHHADAEHDSRTHVGHGCTNLPPTHGVGRRAANFCVTRAAPRARDARCESTRATHRCVPLRELGRSPALPSRG